MKKKMLVVALIVICLAVCAAGSYAYYVTEAPAHSVITTNGVSIEILQNGQARAAAPLAPMPGGSADYDVAVKALDAACWVRIKAAAEFTAADGSTMSLTEDAVNAYVSIAGTSEKWQYNAEDGWYYFSEPLAEGAESELFISELAFSGEMDNEFQGSSVTVTVTAEATQSANNGTDGISAVWG